MTRLASTRLALTRLAFTRLASTRLVPAALAVALATVAGPARADTEGKTGRISRIRINTSGSEEHPSYLGSITLKLTGGGQQVEYRWGGSSCPAQKLSEHQVTMLVTAFVERGKTRVTPRYMVGEGPGTRCLVGFEFVAG